MVLKLICAQMMLTKLAVRGAFTVGAVAGAAGIVGLCALREAMKEKPQGARPTTDAAQTP